MKSRHLSDMLTCVSSALLLLLLSLSISLPQPCEAIYVVNVPGVVPVQRGDSAVLRWQLNAAIMPISRPITILNAHDAELVINNFGVTDRKPVNGEVARRMDLTLSDDRKVVEVRFRDVQDTDNGMYTLVISKANDPGVNIPGELLVYFAPEWRGGTGTRTVRARPGEKNVTLNCSVAANPPPRFSWEYAGGGPASSGTSPSQGGSSRRRTMLVDRSEFSWHVIDEVRMEDFGVYTCMAANEVKGRQGETERFVRYFNVTLEEYHDTKMADVAAILVPLLIAIVIVIFVVCCVKRRCRRCRRYWLQRQKKAPSNGDTPHDDEEIDVPLNEQQGLPDLQRTAADGGRGTRHCNGNGDKAIHVQPVTLPPDADADEDASSEPEETLLKTPEHQPARAAAAPENFYAVTRPRHLTQPVRTAPVAPTRTAVTLPPSSNRTTPQPPVQCVQCSPPGTTVAPIPGSQSSKTLPASSNHTPADVNAPLPRQHGSRGRKANSYRPVNFTDPDGTDDVFVPSLRNNVLLPECNRTGMLLNTSSPVHSASDYRRNSLSSASSSDIDEASAASTAPVVKDKPVLENGSKHSHHHHNNNNNNTLPPPPPDVIYADVMVHAAMGDDREKVIGAKDEQSNYVSIDFKRMQSK